ncbi:MAG TPA: DUF5947 family protein [Isosphaeraceae bacterium]|nr:DUF5947 family protein [Isosphaeraceae bacterium]
MQPADAPVRNPLSALRQFVRKPSGPPAERCELCGLAIAAGHAHLLEPATRQLVCSCEPCAVLFSGRQVGRYRRVPRDIWALPEFRLTDIQWEDLHLPINLAFFVQSTPAQRVLALYPSPAGAVESLLTLEAWQTLVVDNPVLGELEPDVEALLVNRMKDVRAYYRTPIDECFKLVGLIRAHWRGLSGGTEVWDEVGRYFKSLHERSRTR